jgi:hypothetical protein
MALTVTPVLPEDAMLPALPGPPHEGTEDEMARVIARLVATDLFGRPGVFQPNILSWRIERWLHDGAWMNLCIRRNWVREPNLAASLYVPLSLNVAPSKNVAITRARIRELETITRQGLALSFATLAAPPDPDPEAPGARLIKPFEVLGTYFP